MTKFDFCDSLPQLVQNPNQNLEELHKFHIENFEEMHKLLIKNIEELHFFKINACISREKILPKCQHEHSLRKYGDF